MEASSSSSSTSHLWDWRNTRPSSRQQQPNRPGPGDGHDNQRYQNQNHTNYYQLPVHAVPGSDFNNGGGGGGGYIARRNSAIQLQQQSQSHSPSQAQFQSPSQQQPGSPWAKAPPPLPPKPPKQYVQSPSSAVYEFRALPADPIDRPLGPRANSQRSQFSPYSQKCHWTFSNQPSPSRSHSHSSYGYSPVPAHRCGVDDEYDSFDRDRMDYPSSTSPSTDADATTKRTASTSNSSYTAYSTYSSRSNNNLNGTSDDNPWNLDRPVDMPSVPCRSSGEYGYEDNDEEGSADGDYSFGSEELSRIMSSDAPSKGPPLPPIPMAPPHNSSANSVFTSSTTSTATVLPDLPPRQYYDSLVPLSPSGSGPQSQPLPSVMPQGPSYLPNNAYHRMSMPNQPSLPLPQPPQTVSPSLPLRPLSPPLSSPFHPQYDTGVGSPNTISSIATAIPARSPGNIPSVSHAPSSPNTPPFQSLAPALSEHSPVRPSVHHALPPLPHKSSSSLSSEQEFGSRAARQITPVVSYQQMTPTDPTLTQVFQQLPKRNSLPPPLNRARSSDMLAASTSSSYRSSVSHSLMVQLGLPSLPKPVRTWTQLSSKDYNNCREPWALSSIAAWLILLFEKEALIPFKDITQCLVGLFSHVIPTLNWVRVEQIAQSVINSFRSSGFFLIVTSDNCGGNSVEKITFGDSSQVNGVLPILIGKGCYTSCHDSESTGSHANNMNKCYSCRCSRTIPIRPKLLTDSQMMARVAVVANEQAANIASVSSGISTGANTGPSSAIDPSSMNSSDWAAFWNISASHLASLSKREIRRQYAIHELIMGEDSFVADLNILVSVYGQSLPSNIMRQQKAFIEGAFGSVTKLIECNNTHLLRSLKLRQQQQGPFVEGIADIVLSWIKLARDPYVAYANSYVRTDRRLRREKDANPAFSAWLEKAAKDPRAKGYPHSFYFHRAIPRLARYALLLRTILEATLESDPEYDLLSKCISECDSVATECNKRVADVENNMEILTLAEHIQFKGVDQSADLRLTDPRRSIVHTGDILRRGEHRLDWVDTRLILLDNFLLLTKNRKGVTGKFYVTKRPIPLDLLVLESCSDDPVSKSSTKFGAGVFSTGAATTTGTTLQASQSQVDSVGDDLLYPFRVTHLGQAGATYTLYAHCSADRDKWHSAIVSAKKRHYFTVHSIHSEPFRLRVLSDVAFGYDVPVKLPVCTPANAVDRALSNRPLSKTRPLINSKINCGVSFVFVDGIEYWMLGLDFGIYVYDSRPGSIWRRCLDLPRISQMVVMEDFNLLIVVSDRALVYYHLDELIGSMARGTGPNACPVGYRLSQHRRVGFFTVGIVKTRLVLFYKRNDGLSSTFKVLEPIREKGSHRRRSKLTIARSMAFSSTEYFRENEKFSISSEVYGMSLLKNSFAVHTSKGFEALSLDQKTPRTIPVMGSLTSGTVLPILRKSNISRPPSLDAFKRRIESAKPINMFRVAADLILLCYDDLAIYVDNHGIFTGPSVIWFLCRAKTVALQLPYLIIFDTEMIEIRKAVGGQLKQVISGKDIRAIDTREGQIKIAMAHPRLPGRQLVLDMMTNEFVVDDEASSLSGL